MKASELRIGNYVTTINRGGDVHLPTGITEVVGGIGLFTIDLYDYKKHFTEQVARVEGLGNIIGIPLTEEWLLRFGFKMDGIGHWWMNEEFDFYEFVDRNEDGFMLVIAGEEHKETYVKHVHQLQNLYFALVGEELKIQEV